MTLRVAGGPVRGRGIRGPRASDPLLAAGFRVINDPASGVAPAGYLCARDVPIWLPQSDGALASFAANVLPREYMDGRWWNRVDPAFTAGPLRSHEFSNAAWTAVAINSPMQDGPAFGGSASWGLTETTATAYRYLQTTVSWVAGTAYSARIVVSNRAGSRFVQVRFPSAAFGSTLVASFDPRTGVGQAIGAGVTIHPARQIAGGWILSASATATATANAPLRVQLVATQSVADESYAGDGASGVNIWGVNLTNTAYPVPMVQVGAASVAIGNHTWAPTLAAMGFVLGGEWTAYMEYQLAGAPGAAQPIPLAMSDNTFNNSVYLNAAASGAANAATWSVVNAGVGQATSTGVGPVGAPNITRKTIFRLKANDLRPAFDGVLSAGDNTATLPLVDRMYIGANWSGSGNRFFGRIGRIAVHQSVGVMDAQLQALSTL